MSTPAAKPRPTKKMLRGDVPISNKAVAECAAKDPDRSLTEQQRAFAYYWAQGESIMTSTVKAGYSRESMIGYKLRHDPAVLKLYESEKAKFEADNKMSRQKVLEGLMEGIELAKLVSEPAAVINGWKTIGQMCGYFEPVKKQISIDVSGTVNMKRIEAMSDADLLKLIKGEVQDVVFTELAEEESNDS